MYLGIDRTGGGWLTAENDGDAYSFEKYPSIFSVWKNHVLDADRDLEQILVDVPIGLRDDGEPRECDTAARKRARSSTVFPTPTHAAVFESAYVDAKQTNLEETDGEKSLNTQTWSITPGIREVHELFDKYPDAQDLMRESHPEVCLWALNDHQTVESKKKTDEGFDERVEILAPHGEHVRDSIDDAIERFAMSGVKPDDFVDALALAITAAGDLASLPDDSSQTHDETWDVPCEIVYRADG